MANVEKSYFVIPRQIDSYIKRLQVEYKRAGEVVLSELLREAAIHVDEGVEYDNWNGGIHGHNVIFSLPAELLGKIPLTEQGNVEEKVKTDLQLASKLVEQEFVAGVYFTCSAQGQTQRSRKGQLNTSAEITAMAFWRPNSVRLFMSHRDTHKKTAHALAELLNEFAISSFVAHDTIEPDSVWQNEIEKALDTMEVMIALISDDFFESAWTNQEIGFALGKGVPVVLVRIGSVDPKGFLHMRQAVKTSASQLPTAIEPILRIIKSRVDMEDRLREEFVSRFIVSENWATSEERFKRMLTLSGYGQLHVNKIIQAFGQNSQLYNSNYLGRGGRLINFLTSCTGKEYRRVGSIIIEQEDDQAIPF
jgi:TIR domain